MGLWFYCISLFFNNWIYVNLLFLLIKVKKDYFYEHKKSLITILLKVFSILLPCAFLLNYISSFEEFWRLGSPISKLLYFFGDCVVNHILLLFS